MGSDEFSDSRHSLAALRFAEIAHLARPVYEMKRGDYSVPPAPVNRLEGLPEQRSRQPR